MPESDDVEKFLSDQKSFEDRKQSLIDDLLRQRADAMKAFDEKLAKLGYHPADGAGKTRKSHHRMPSTEAAKPKEKAKA